MIISPVRNWSDIQKAVVKAKPWPFGASPPTLLVSPRGATVNVWLRFRV